MYEPRSNHFNNPNRSCGKLRSIAAAVVLLVLLSGCGSSHQFSTDARICSQTLDKPELAIEHCTRAIDSGAGSKETLAEFFYNRGQAYVSKSEFERAVHDFTEAIQLNPKFARAFSFRGKIYTYKLDYDRAIQDFSEAIRLNPNDASAFEYRSTLYLSKGDSNRAVHDFNEAMRLDRIFMSVKRELCGSDLCDFVLEETKRVSFKQYSVYFYDLGRTSYGTAAAVVKTEAKGLRLLKVFSGLGPNGRVMEVNPKTFDGQDYIEVYEETSKGNGEIELFQLKEDKVSLVFNARGVDEHDDGSMYDGGVLRASYPDINRDGHFDIVLDGTVLSYGESPDHGVLTRQCRRVFLWNQKLNSFRETTDGAVNPQLCARLSRYNRWVEKDAKKRASHTKR